MKKRSAEQLAKELDFNSPDQYYQYIIDSMINGQREQVKRLFSQLIDYDKQAFLIDFCNQAEDEQGLIVRSTRNICITTLLNA